MTRSLRAWALSALLALAAGALPGSVVAATFSLTTPYPAVTVEPGGAVTLDLNLTTPVAERVGLAVTRAPSGWATTLRGGGYEIDAVQTGGTAPQLQLQVNVPTTATAGTYDVDVTATAAQGRVTLPIQLVIQGGGGGNVSMTSDFPSLRGSNSSTFTFNLTLSNETAQRVTFNLQGQGPDGWTVEVHPSDQAQAVTTSVDAGGTSTINVTVTPPSTVAAGNYPITVAAAGGPQPVQTQLQVQITGSPQLKLSTPDGTLNAQVTAGGTGTVTMIVQNTGSVPLTNVQLADTPPTGWTVTFSPASVASIAPNASSTVTATIQPASNALAGDYDLTLSASAGGATDSLDIRTTVQTSALWGLVGLALIVLVLVGLAWVFRRYGRR